MSDDNDTPPPPPPFVFEGFTESNTTPVPDVLFDRLLPHLGHAELKVLLYIIRRTRGFKKTYDAVSLDQFVSGITTKEGVILDYGCGIASRTMISKALQSLELKGIVVSQKSVKSNGGNAVTVYALNFKGGVNLLHPPGKVASPPLVTEVHPQQTVKQDKKPRYRYKRKITESESDEAIAERMKEHLDSYPIPDWFMNQGDDP